MSHVDDTVCTLEADAELRHTEVAVRTKAGNAHALLHLANVEKAYAEGRDLFTCPSEDIRIYIAEAECVTEQERYLPNDDFARLARELRGNAAKAHARYLDLLEHAEAWKRTALAFTRASDAFRDVSKTFQRHLRESTSKDV